MDITWTWKITQLTTVEHDGLPNVISHVHWQLTGTDEHGHSASSNGTLPFQLETVVSKDPFKRNPDFVAESEFSADSFTPYEELTEEQVISWVQNHSSSSVVDEVKAGIIKRLEKMHTPQVQVLPWATPE